MKPLDPFSLFINWATPIILSLYFNGIHKILFVTKPVFLSISGLNLINIEKKKKEKGKVYQ